MESFKNGYWGYTSKKGNNNIFTLGEYVTWGTGDYNGKIAMGFSSEKLYYDPVTGKFTWFLKEGSNEGYYRFILFFPPYDNISEWKEASGITKHLIHNSYIANPGDFDCPFMVTATIRSNSNGKITLGEKQLSWKSFNLKEGDVKIRFNFYNELIEGINDTGQVTKNIYNEYIISGSWFKIPKGIGILQNACFIYEGLIDPVLEYKILYI